MKIHRNLISIFLVISVFFSLMSPTYAIDFDNYNSARSSAYINAVWASASGDIGSVKVSFSITATGKMNSLGATIIEIKDSSGTTVRTFKSSSTGGLMGSNATYYSSSKTWYGATSGCKYYAVVYFKASDSSGYDTTSYTTGYCTAR